MVKAKDMKEKRLYIVDINDIPENESFFDWSDERVIETAKKKGSVLKIEEFVERWNEGFVPDSDHTYMRLLNRRKKLVGYQPFKFEEPLICLPDWWVFKTREDVESYLKWGTFDECTIEEVYDDEVEEPNIITFDDYIFQWAVGIFAEENRTPSNYEDLLIWLRDNGVPKTRSGGIAERILNYYNL